MGGERWGVSLVSRTGSSTSYAFPDLLVPVVAVAVSIYLVVLISGVKWRRVKYSLPTP